MVLANGAIAPAVSLTDQHGVPTPLVRGDGPRLVVFYPFAFSGVCTGELAELNEQADDLGGADVVAVSCDAMFANRAFSDAQGLSFPLLSDFWPHGEVCRAFDAFDEERGCPARTTVLLDADGIVRWSVQSPIGEARSLADYRSAVAGLSS